MLGAFELRLRSAILMFLLSLGFIGFAQPSTFAKDKVKALFLGDKGHHRPKDRADQLIPVLKGRGIDIEYTEDLNALNLKKLSQYDCLIIYGNMTKITPEQEEALLTYVRSGKGFVPLHCASYCFLNSPKYIALVGAQFRRHGGEVFRTEIAKPDHEVMRRFGGFESWDETYVHHKHNDDGRIVLSYRKEGDGKEPWTWVRREGKGRVFYTAWGHDARTWGNPGFQNLVERGIRWVSRKNVASVPAYLADLPFPVPEMTAFAKDPKPFKYVDAKIPNYIPGRRWGVQKEPGGKMQLPVSPEESMKHHRVPKGFKVELFASEEMLEGKPICMSWDEAGRLWIGETKDYPNDLQPPGKGNDRIRILEDTDGDGKADKTTVFVDKISIPSSIAFYKGGIIVHAQTQTIYFKDTNGDDKADVDVLLFTGWGMGDTHGGASNLQWGLDNWIWGMQGYNYSRFRVAGKEVGFRMGFYRFKPNGSDMEFVRSTNNNTWGMGFSEGGLVFGSTANRNPSVYMPIANRYYEAVRGWGPSTLGSIAKNHLFNPATDKVRQVDQFGGYTAAAGHALYTARTYPKEYWNRTAFVNGPTGHLTGTFVIKQQGTDFKSENLFNLFDSRDEWTAPIMAEVGPDGHVWMIDWYNFIVQHNPTPRGFRNGRGNAYVTDLRDKKHGRIYRIVYDQAEKAERFTLKNASAEKLVSALKHENRFWRIHAQRLLVERGIDDVVPLLGKLIADRSVDSLGLNVGAIHALWTLHGLGVMNEGHPLNDAGARLAQSALNHPSWAVRRNAVLVLPRTDNSTQAILAKNLLGDSEPLVRLSTLLSLSEMPANKSAGGAILTAMGDASNMNDRWLPDAAIAAAAKHDVHFLASLGKAKPSGRVLDIVARISEHFARGADQEGVATLLQSLDTMPTAFSDVIIKGLEKGWPADKPAKLSAQTEKKLLALLPKLSIGSQGLLIKLASSWGSKSFVAHAAKVAESMVAALQDPKRSDDDRVAAAREVLSFLPREVDPVKKILDQISPQTPPKVAEGFVDALGLSHAPGLGSLIVERLGTFTTGTRNVALRVLLSRGDNTKAFVAAVEKREASLADLSLDQKQALSRHPDRDIAQRVRKLLESGGKLPNPDRLKVIKKLEPLTHKKGDPKAGKIVYEKQCAKCHVHGSMGTRIGPDLTGMAVHPKEELLTNIIDPNQSVEGNFRVYTVITKQGQVLRGLLSSESRTAIEILDAEQKKHNLLRENIIKLDRSEESLMPEGFESLVSEKEIVDLLEFLTDRGKFLPLPLDKAATIVSTLGMFNSKQAGVERLILPNWKPRVVEGVPFQFVDAQGTKQANVIMLHGTNGVIPPKMPKSAKVPCNSSVKSIHLLSGVSGWGYPAVSSKTPTVTVRLHLEGGGKEDHILRNGEHFADYIRRTEVPKSKFAFNMRGQQMRYIVIHTKTDKKVKEIEFIKGDDPTSPIILSVTIESP